MSNGETEIVTISGQLRELAKKIKVQKTVPAPVVILPISQRDHCVVCKIPRFDATVDPTGFTCGSYGCLREFSEIYRDNEALRSRFEELTSKVAFENYNDEEAVFSEIKDRLEKSDETDEFLTDELAPLLNIQTKRKVRTVGGEVREEELSSDCVRDAILQEVKEIKEAMEELMKKSI